VTPEEHRGTLDEAIEDLCDQKARREIEEKEQAHADFPREPVYQDKENRSVDEIEAEGAFAEVAGGAEV
jgi:hypothetical protein